MINDHRKNRTIQEQFKGMSRKDRATGNGLLAPYSKQEIKKLKIRVIPVGSSNKLALAYGPLGLIGAPKATNRRKTVRVGNRVG